MGVVEIILIAITILPGIVIIADNDNMRPKK